MTAEYLSRVEMMLVYWQLQSACSKVDWLHRQAGSWIGSRAATLQGTLIACRRDGWHVWW